MQLIIILAIIVLIFLMVSVFVGSTNLDQIKITKDEKPLLDEEGIRVESKGIGPRITVFSNSRVKITDKRIIISQKMPFFKKFRVLYILSFVEKITENKFGVKKGVLCANLEKESVAIEKEKNTRFINIEPQDGLGALSYIRIYPNNPEEILKIIKK